MIIIYLAIKTMILSASVQGQCPITNASIHFGTRAVENDNPEMWLIIIEGNTTGAQATSVTWRRNGSVVNRNTMTNSGRFFDGGGEHIVDTGPCSSQMYRVALAVYGYHPGEYTYTVTNGNTPTPVTSLTIRIQDPGPPTNIVLLQRSPGRVLVTWTPPSEFPEAVYYVYFNTTNVYTGGTEVIGNVTILEDIPPGSFFTVRIRASIGTYLSVPAVSDSSGLLQEITITVSLVTNVSIALTFSLPDQSQLDMYTVTLTSTTCSDIPIRNGLTVNNFITISNLEAGVEYSVNVSAAYISTRAVNSNYTSVTTNETAPSGSPGVPVPVVVNTTSITLMWSEINCLQRNGVITSYIIYYGEGTSRNKTIQTRSDATTYTVIGLRSFTHYTFSVAGVNQVNSGPFSAATELIRTAEDRPSEVRNLKFKIGLFSIILNWDEPEIIPGILRHYNIIYSVNGTIQSTQTVNYNSFTISNLYPNTEVSNITVSASTGAGEGPYVRADNTTTLDKPAEVRNISLNVVSTTSVRVSWNHTGPHDTNKFIVYYNLAQINSSNQKDLRRTVPAPTSLVVIGGLVEGKEYIFGVQARAEVGGASISGTSAYSDPILVKFNSSQPSGIYISLESILVAVVSAVATGILYSVLLVISCGIVKSCKKVNSKSFYVEISSVQIPEVQMKSCSDMEKETEEQVSQNKYELSPEVIYANL